MGRLLSQLVWRRFGAACGLAFAAVVLAGCFVTSGNPVSGTGPDADPQLAGAWRGLDDDGKIEPGLFLHAVPHKSGEGLALVMVDNDGVSVLEATTVEVGANKFMNATFKYAPGASPQDREMQGAHIIRYEIKGGRLSFWLLDPKKVADAVEDKLLKGDLEGSGATKSVRLTATSQELETFLSRPEARKYFHEKPVALVRFAG